MALKDGFLSRFAKFHRKERPRPESTHKTTPRTTISDPVPHSHPQSEPEFGSFQLAPDNPFQLLWVQYRMRMPPPNLQFDIPLVMPAPPPEPEVSEDSASSDAAVSDEAVSDEAASDEAASDAVTPDETVPPEVLENKPIPLLSEQEEQEEFPKLERFLTNTAEYRLSQIAAEGAVLNAEAHVFVPASRIAAWIIIYPPYNGGMEITYELLQKALDPFHISVGLDEELLQRIPNEKDRYFHLYLVAKGVPSLPGKDGYVIDLFSRSPVRTLTEDANGNVDYAAVEIFQNVGKGDVICRIVPPTPCRDGITISGQVCYAVAGKPAIVPQGRNTALNEDKTCLIATVPGHVEFSGRSFQVKPVMDIGGNVDFSTGNVNCLGDVHVHGDICSGFTVRATGNITVDGVVEACVVEAGGDLIVRKGVQGNNQAILRAHRNIFAKYLESSSVYARENLESDCVVNCNIYSDGVVRIRSGRGTIIGGQICAAREVSAITVGTRSEAPTTIILGGRPCEAFERETLVHEIEEMEEELKKLDHQPESPVKLRQMSKLRMQISVNRMKLQQFDKEMETLAAESSAGDGRLTCSMLYPGVEIIIGQVSRKIDEEYRACTATLKGGEIILF